MNEFIINALNKSYLLNQKSELINTCCHHNKIIAKMLEKLYYFVIPSSNENNLIYIRSSEWGKHDKQQQISSSGVALSFVF